MFNRIDIISVVAIVAGIDLKYVQPSIWLSTTAGNKSGTAVAVLEHGNNSIYTEED
jgi:hypothetical protein